MKRTNQKKLICLLTVLLLQNYALNVYAQDIVRDTSSQTVPAASVSAEPVSASGTDAVIPQESIVAGEPTTEAITPQETIAPQETPTTTTPTTTTQTTTTESIAPAESTAATTTTTESTSIPTTEAAPVVTSGASSTTNTAPSGPFVNCNLSSCDGCIGNVGTWTRKELCLLAKSRK